MFPLSAIFAVFSLADVIFAISGSNVPSLPSNYIIPRQAIVEKYSPVRSQSNLSTPLQVGNGGFAFGADVTGLQTFQRFSIMSDWGWKNDTLPPNTTPNNFTGMDWDVHGELKNFDFPNPAEANISQWMIANPNRVNLGAISLTFQNASTTENDIQNKSQKLDIYTGILKSSFIWSGETVQVTTACHPEDDTIGIELHSELLRSGELGLQIDFPFNSGVNKFSAPFVGLWNQSSKHSTSISVIKPNSTYLINHTTDGTSHYTTISGTVSVTRNNSLDHVYFISSASPSSSLYISFNFSPSPPTCTTLPNTKEITSFSKTWWKKYWNTGGFIDLVTNSTATVQADELQRRVILSQYLLALNEASDWPSQESGLVNNGWYGKFHMEMIFWHSAHWLLWGRKELLDRCIDVYHKFTTTALERAQVQQGYSKGARWPKMTDPTGRCAPGEINNLLIWNQVHPIWFAELYWRQSPTQETLDFWLPVINITADFMASFAYYNESTSVYDLGSPMYIVSETTAPNVTTNPAWELSYWRWGLEAALKFHERAGRQSPGDWKTVSDGLAQLPEQEGTYVLYEGIQNPWNTTAYISDHPNLVGLYGWLPPTSKLNITTAIATTKKIRETWSFSGLYGWDWPMLAMSAARIGNGSQAVADLLSQYNNFDDAGYPVGTVTPTPYFPASGGLLYAVAQMAAGWDGSVGNVPGFPSWEEGWGVTFEDLHPGL